VKKVHLFANVVTMNYLSEIKSGSSFDRNLVNDVLILGFNSVLHIILVKAHNDQNS